MHDASPPETERAIEPVTFTDFVPKNANDVTVSDPDIVLGTLSTELTTSFMVEDEDVTISCTPSSTGMQNSNTLCGLAECWVARKA
mmetsp:Transcript_66022/g.174984  ORF Transcript_66022/g.174984 Transcript_66022/m.174984 type:complete len:86 (+) Transcript_66022:1911-2168(+)